MCAAACVWAGVQRIVFAASTQAFTAILPGGPGFDISCAQVIAGSNAAVDVCGPELEAEALAAMRQAAPS